MFEMPFLSCFVRVYIIIVDILWWFTVARAKKVKVKKEIRAFNVSEGESKTQGCSVSEEESIPQGNSQ